MLRTMGTSASCHGSKEPLISSVRFRSRVEYAVLRAAAGVFRGLPAPMAFGLARGAGRAVHAAFPKYRRRMRQQLHDALGVDAAETARIARQVHPGLALTVVESLRLLGAPRERFLACFDAEASQPAFDAVDALAREGPVIFVTGHLGNWEVAGALGALRGWLAGSVARPLRNPLADAWLLRQRRAAGQTIWAKRGALVHVLRALRDGHGVGFVADQDGGTDGVFAPFFGQPASTMAAPVDLAMRTGRPLVVGAALRGTGPLRFRFRATAPIWPDSSAEPVSERARLLAAMNAGLERWIREAPEQWLWTHRRWRTLPPVPAPGASASGPGGGASEFS